MYPEIGLADIEEARERIAPYVHRTPLFSSRTLSRIVGGEIRLKGENLQRGGSFKIRGAMNKLRSIAPETRSRGVVAFSSGNHAQGVALAARLLGVAATVVMPEDAVATKVSATKAYGARVVQEGVDAATRSTRAEEIAAAEGGTLIPPFDDPAIVAGQGSVGLEIVEDDPEVTSVVVPLGGGGLLSGVALAVTSRKPGVRVYGVEPEGGDDGARSLEAGRIVRIPPPRTIADGARTTEIGELPFAIIRERVAGILTVPDEALLAAMHLLLLRAKLLVEPTGALAVAALLSGRIPDPGRCVAVLSGGNVEAEMLQRALDTPIPWC